MLRLDINTVFTVINLLILFVLIKRFLFKPVRAVLAKREAEIQAMYQQAEESNQAAEALKTQYKESIASIEAERQETLAKSKMEASKEYDEIIQNAHRKADKLLKEAEEEAAREASAKQHEMQEQMAVLVAQAAYKIAAAKDSSENDKQLFDKFLNDQGSVKAEKKD